MAGFDFEDPDYLRDARIFEEMNADAEKNWSNALKRRVQAGLITAEEANTIPEQAIKLATLKVLGRGITASNISFNEALLNELNAAGWTVTRNIPQPAQCPVLAPVNKISCELPAGHSGSHQRDDSWWRDF